MGLAQLFIVEHPSILSDNRRGVGFCPLSRANLLGRTPVQIRCDC